jgi:hypothetical protein
LWALNQARSWFLARRRKNEPAASFIRVNFAGAVSNQFNDRLDCCMRVASTS